MFKCGKDPDIESFLHNKAINFENRNLCTVYLLLNENDFNKNILKIEAYFTLSHKYITLQESVSGTKRKEVAFSKADTSTHFVLIGHLGKYINKENNSLLSCKDILDRAFEVIQKADSLIKCRCVLVECNDNKKVHKVYENYNFKYLQYDGGHHQFYKRIR